jgi:hypothetical protein
MAENARGRNNWIGGRKQGTQADVADLWTSGPLDLWTTIMADQLAVTAIHTTR